MEGKQIINVYAIDEFGLKSEIRELVIFVNNSGKFILNDKPPTIEITKPNDNEKIHGVIQINGIAKDDQANLLLVQIKIDNNNWHSLDRNLTNWEINLSTQEMKNGYHIIYARSFDGHYFSKIDNVTINIQNNNPIEQNTYITTISSSLVFSITVILIILIILLIIKLNMTNNKRKRRRMKKFFYPIMIFAVILNIIFSTIYISIFQLNSSNSKSDNHQNDINNTTIPSITFYSLDGVILTNENLKNKVVIINFIYAELEPGKSMTYNILRLKKELNNPNIIFITIDTSHIISEIEFYREYKEEMKIDWEIGYDIDNLSKKCGVENVPYSLIILDKDNSIKLVIKDSIFNRQDVINSINSV